MNKIITDVENIIPGNVVEGIKGERIEVDGEGTPYLVGKDSKRTIIEVDEMVFAEIEQIADPYDSIFI